MESKFRGIFSPICTPFTDNGGSIDEGALRALIDYQLDNGVHGIIPCGGTGEFYHLSLEERKRVTEITVKQVNGRVPVMAHTGACSTREVIELSKHAQSVGCDALMIVPPYYEVPSDDEIVGHYEAISRAVPLPIMVYSIPAHSKINLSAELLARLVEVENVKMLKDSTSNLTQFQRIVNELGDKLIVFNGSDTGAYAGLTHGARGCVWGVANPTPKACVEMFELTVEKKDYLKAKELWKYLYPLNHFHETRGYAAVAKAATKLAGLDIGEPRLPLRPLTPQKRDELKKILEPLGVLSTAQTVAAG